MLDPALQIKFQRQAEMLANKVKKRFRHLAKRFARQNIEVFRLYDWDIPEIRAAVDWYAGHLVIGEYTRNQTVAEWLPLMGAAVAAALDVPPDRVHLKERRTGKHDGKRYERIAHTNQKIIVSEGDLRFYVNPYDYVDTGLFGDHRLTRKIVRDLALGRDLLNLYCYTAAFTCYAAKGGARSSVSVDRSETAVTWAGENLALNNIPADSHLLIQAHTLDFLEKARRQGRTFDLAVVDPPSFSMIRNKDYEFDIAKDHPVLLQAVKAVMRKDALIFFSTNHQNFVPCLDDLGFRDIEEITAQTIPEDYISKRRSIHRCWRIRV